MFRSNYTGEKVEKFLDAVNFRGANQVGVPIDDIPAAAGITEVFVTQNSTMSITDHLNLKVGDRMIILVRNNADTTVQITLPTHTNFDHANGAFVYIPSEQVTTIEILCYSHGGYRTFHTESALNALEGQDTALWESVNTKANQLKLVPKVAIGTNLFMLNPKTDLYELTWVDTGITANCVVDVSPFDDTMGTYMTTAQVLPRLEVSVGQFTIRAKVDPTEVSDTFEISYAIKY